SAKNEKVRALFGLELADGDYSLRFYEETYRNEVTASIYDVNFLRLLAKKIKSIEVPVLWIGVNRVVSGWNGNYFSERPINMNVIMEYQEALTLEMSGSQAEVWVPCVGDSEIKKYTVDNVHFSRVGFNMLSGQLRSRLRRVI
ncbi:hypothetical protein, partial [Sphingobium sp. Ndbn-10]|uniref:hypothetical protein n=1 Tax=Sphingobium sp. Ndbn-10 TaxID=1667223 RepID=UPI00147AAF17